MVMRSREFRQAECDDVAGEDDSIRGLVKSWARSSWAAALFGVSQVGNALREAGAGREPAQTAEGFDSVTRTVEAQLDGGMRRMFQTGDQMQRGLVDATCGALSGDGDTPRRALKMAFDVAQLAAGAACALAPESESRLTWLEFRNKLEAFNLFAHVDLALGLSRDGAAAPLGQLVARASSLDPFRAVWATEGVGHFYAESLRDGAAPASFRGQAAHLPASSLAALHAGAGLSFAGRCLESLTPSSPAGDVRRALEQFFALCDDGAHEGFAGGAYEALGLSARTLHPQLLGLIDRHLREIDEELVAYFWHGVGRGIYFVPTNFLPDAGALGRALGQARQEPPHELGRVNALAGLVWALVLVNLRHPEVLESFLRRHARELAGSDAFANGLCSALLIWRDSSPDDEALNALCRHRPADAHTSDLWDEWVSRPCAEALRRYYPVLRGRGLLGSVFRYQSLPELVERLEAAAADETNAR